MTKFKVFLTIFLLIVFYFLVSVKQHNEKTELVFWFIKLKDCSTTIELRIEF